ncbi:MAG TPA: pyridoxal kinase [Dongiaceae bacterium]|nr:pyridoxal kinase [Dongiaceae bacterium]
MNILSIQSQVVYGHVGNSAALFILQRLGHDTWSIPTTLFSNHLARPSWTGRVLHRDDIAALIDGLSQLGVLDRLDALVTGYLGDPGNVPIIAELIDKLRRGRPGFIYACDPVMGDDGALYVKPALADAIAAELVGRADILTPNQFELQRLSGMALGDQASTIAAAKALHDRHGIANVIATGVVDPAAPDEIAALAATADGVWRASGRRIAVPASGAGDSFAALLLGHYLRHKNLPQALAAAVAGASAIFAATAAAHRDELAIIGSQEIWANLPDNMASRIG